MRRTRHKPKRLLTEVELEFMTILWRLGEASVRDLLDELARERRLAYTSAATILRILEQKGFVTSRKLGRTYLYAPSLAKDEYQSRSLQDISKKLFDDTPAALVSRLIDDEALSDEALAEIRKLLDEKLKP
ncbi:MAG: BlaI/MecI/CopY family transcriptional regulator [Kiloniellales bacterium]|nr:BlaI/MecI/CopY family transcriptional regulator [Kiloniellales bacterium]